MRRIVSPTQRWITCGAAALALSGTARAEPPGEQRVWLEWAAPAEGARVAGPVGWVEVRGFAGVGDPVRHARRRRARCAYAPRGRRAARRLRAGGGALRWPRRVVFEAREPRTAEEEAAFEERLAELRRALEARRLETQLAREIEAARRQRRELEVEGEAPPGAEAPSKGDAPTTAP